MTPSRQNFNDLHQGLFTTKNRRGHVLISPVDLHSVQESLHAFDPVWLSQIAHGLADAVAETGGVVTEELKKADWLDQGVSLVMILITKLHGKRARNITLRAPLDCLKSQSVVVVLIINRNRLLR